MKNTSPAKKRAQPKYVPNPQLVKFMAAQATLSVLEGKKVPHTIEGITPQKGSRFNCMIGCGNVRALMMAEDGKVLIEAIFALSDEHLDMLERLL